MEFTPDKELASRIASAVNAADSASIRDVLFSLVDVEKPSIETLALACGLLRPTSPNEFWHEQKRLALTSQLQAMLTRAHIDAQEKMSAAADRLATRNFIISLVSMFVALASLGVSLAGML